MAKGKESDDPRKHLKLLFPFMIRRRRLAENPMDKFCPKMDPCCVQSFAINGPLRRLDSALSSFQRSRKKFNYKAMLQQIFPSLGIFHPWSRFLDLEQGELELEQEPEEVPKDASEEESEPEYSGRADYALRTITKTALEKFKKEHPNPEINWNNPDKLELASTVFEYIDAELTRTDAVISCKSDCVTDWAEKTLPNLTSYANQAALDNMKNGFSPRPVYMLAVDSKAWRLAILDPQGFISVNDEGQIQGLDEFEKQQKTRAEWVKKKGGGAAQTFGAAQSFTRGALEEILKETKEKIWGGEYVVSSLWVEHGEFSWNGGGFEHPLLLPGTLTLFEGLLRLVCGERICRAGWTSERMRGLFGRQQRAEITRCLQFERALREPSKPRSLTCSYSKEFVAAIVKEVGKRKDAYESGDDFRKGFISTVELVREYVQSLARLPDRFEDILTLARLYGGEECAELLAGEEAAKAIGGASTRHIVVHNDMAEADGVLSLKAVVIPVERRWCCKLDTRDYTVLLCAQLSSSYRFWPELFQPGASGGLVIIAKDVDKESRRMLRRVNTDAAVLKVSSGSLDALQEYLHVELADAEFISCVKHRTKLSLCRNDLIVFGEAEGGHLQPVQSILEMRISGASRGDFLDRTLYMQAAATAITSSLAKGVVSASVFAAASVRIRVGEGSPAFCAGANVVTSALRAAYMRHPKRQLAVDYAEMFAEQTLEESLKDSNNQADLVESVEETLAKAVDIFNSAVSFLRFKRARAAPDEEEEVVKRFKMS